MPYVYDALYEGGERTPGVFLTGKTPDRQLRPAIRWLTQGLGVRSWAIAGDDYIWPRRSAERARSYLAECGARLCEQVFVALDTADFTPALRRVERSGCDAVLSCWSAPTPSPSSASSPHAASPTAACGSAR